MKLKLSQPLHSEDEMLYMSIKNARCELDTAVDIFNELTDNTAVDYAAYNILAARAKYSYLLQLAKAKGLPVIVHDREAHGDTLDILKATKPSGVLHCFSGSVEMAREVIKLGMFLGFNGVATFKNARKIPEVIREIPLDRIVLETDCPYLAPEPHRGKRNDSSFIPFIAQRIGEILGISAQEVLDVTNKNARALYNLT